MTGAIRCLSDSSRVGVGAGIGMSAKRGNDPILGSSPVVYTGPPPPRSEADTRQ